MNLNLVIDTSLFRPFDYNIALNAIKEYNTGYEKSLAVYDKIALTLGDLASAVEGTEKAKLIYDAYNNRFNAAADDFSKGMNYRNAAELGQLRKLYGTLIRQLELANEAMVKEAERRRAAKPELNMLYQDIGNLDDYMVDPNRTLGSYSGTLLTNEVSAMTLAMGKLLVEMRNNGLLDNDTLIWLQTKGFKGENIDKAVAEVAAGGIANVSDPVLRNILQSAMTSSGINNWADENTRRAAENMAARGLYGGIGDATTGTYENKEYDRQRDWYYKLQEMMQSYRNSLALQQDKANLDMQLLRAKADADTKNTYGLTPRSYLQEKNALGKTKYDLIKESVEGLLDPEGKIKVDYTGESGINPIVIYDEYKKWADDHKKALGLWETPFGFTTGGSASFHAYNNASVPDYDEAKKYIQEKYGVKDIISDDLYDALKTLGYGEANNFNWHTSKDINQEGRDSRGFPVTLRVTINEGDNLRQDALSRLDNLASRSTVSYLTGTNISKAVAASLREGLTTSESASWVHELKDDYSTGSPVDWKTAIKLLGEDYENLLATGIDIGKEQIIMVLADGTKLSVDPEAFGRTFAKDWKAYILDGIGGLPGKRQIKNDATLSDKLKADYLYGLQEALTLNLGQLTGRNWFQTAPQQRQ